MKELIYFDQAKAKREISLIQQLVSDLNLFIEATKEEIQFKTPELVIKACRDLKGVVLGQQKQRLEQVAQVSLDPQLSKGLFVISEQIKSAHELGLKITQDPNVSHLLSPDNFTFIDGAFKMKPTLKGKIEESHKVFCTTKTASEGHKMVIALAKSLQDFKEFCSQNDMYFALVNVEKWFKEDEKTKEISQKLDQWLTLVKKCNAK